MNGSREEFPNTVQILVGEWSFKILLWWEVPPKAEKIKSFGKKVTCEEVGLEEGDDVATRTSS